ncbi:MAG TPA: hypothetical protein VKY74_26070 [Chloroflexia bacterium]|nr:hypothetical protein [Chloroflexia bacterium]
MLRPFTILRQSFDLVRSQRSLWGAAAVLGLAQSSGLLLPPPSLGQPAAGLLALPVLVLLLGLGVVAVAATNSLLALATDHALGGALPAGQAWRRGWACWWSVLGLGLLLGLLFALPYLVLIGAFLLFVHIGFSQPGFTFWIALASLPLTLVYAPLSGVGQCRVVVAYQAAGDALGQAWRLYRAHPRELTGMALLLLVLPGLTGLIPLTGMWLVQAGPNFVPLRVLLFPLAWLLAAAGSAWTLAAWALVHLELLPPDPPPAATDAPVSLPT